jgi:8-oxo-dGTP pyrophosphatase MutT (NUDIX family)
MRKDNVLEKSPPRLHQVAALPMRKTERGLEICLVTTRETGRWTVPKGWPMKGRKDFDAARIEAEQEAGVIGKPTKKPIGTFEYWKRRETQFDLVEVAVYPLKVTKTLSRWKEYAERQVRWALPAEAAGLVNEPQLADILRSIVPAARPREADEAEFAATEIKPETP